MSTRTTNWAGNVTYHARQIHRPTSVDELQALVAGTDRIRALGTGHSFSTVADSTGDLVSLADLPPTMEIDAANGTVRVAAGVRYGDLSRHLHANGYALHNLGSLPHISVGGACATGTHGSGDRNGNQATAVRAVELVTADGNLVTFDRTAHPDRFPGAVVALGALGVVSALTLDIQPTYQVAQYVYDNLPWSSLTGHLPEIFASGYSVSLFTTWTGPHVDQVWLKRRVDHSEGWDPLADGLADLPDGHGATPHWHGATLADGPRHPVAGMPADHCTQQLGVPGPWHERLPHFRLAFTPSVGRELQSEYLIPHEHAVAALTAVDSIRDRIAPLVQVSEIRTVAADDLWLSPSYRRDSVGIHFTWIDDVPAVTALLPLLEAQLAPFQPRPHWGKLSTMDPVQVRAGYERLTDFARLAAAADPTGKFRNDFVDTYLGT